jgi:hypothetical protein
MKFILLVGAFPFYITWYAFSFHHRCAVLEKFLKTDHLLAIMALPLGPQVGGSSEIYNLCPPCPKDASYQI